LGMALAAAVVFVLSGCGGGGSSGATSSDPPTVAAPGSSKEFTKPGGENKFAGYGDEANTAEREAASLILEENFAARAAGEWPKQCASLSPKAIKKLEAATKAAVPKGGGAQSLKAAAEPLSGTKKIRADTLQGPIDVLMVKGTSAYALYHGTGGKDYAVPMEKVNGEWKVGALVSSEAP
jgi:hypothetical protein